MVSQESTKQMFFAHLVCPIIAFIASQVVVECKV